MAEHFTQWVWAGFASRSLAADEAVAVRAHLRTGCESCAREERFWRVMSVTIRQEREPLPAGSLERALAHGARAAASVAASSERGFRLAFDNFTAPLALSVRGPQARRHCVYELDPEPGMASGQRASVEVMVERVGRSEGWSVVGQLLDPSGEGWRDCSMELTGEAPAAAPVRCRTNGFGEFAFAPAQAGPWRLDLQAGQRHWGIAPLLMP